MVLSSNKLHHFFPLEYFHLILFIESFWKREASPEKQAKSLQYIWVLSKIALLFKPQGLFHLPWKQICISDAISTSWQVFWHHLTQLGWFQSSCMNYTPRKYMALQLLFFSQQQKGLGYHTKNSFSDFSQMNMWYLALATLGKTSADLLWVLTITVSFKMCGQLALQVTFIQGLCAV